MRKQLVVIVGLFATLSAFAITQKGYVRTISRPGYESERLEGVLIRVRGNHNVVMTETTGDFSILMQEMENGDPYSLSAVMKSGYQISEQELIGRTMAGSDRVPLEVTMVSSAQLQAEKNAIMAKARASVEQAYGEQMMALQKALEQKQLDVEQFEQQLTALDDKLMRSEQQIEQMADRYARTDYALLDSTAAAIQQAIEQGDITLAEKLIMEKGRPSERQQRIRELQREVAAQTKDLKQDYYHLYSIALQRFQPDTAVYYLQQRADLDSTDAAAQLDYVKFIHEYMGSQEQVAHYLQLAERQLTRQGDDKGVLMLRFLNEKGRSLYNLHQFKQAIETGLEAVALSEQLYGKDHPYTAGRKTSLAAYYYALGKMVDAKKQLNSALHIYDMATPIDTVSKASVLNNMGAIAYADKQYDEARKDFEASLTLLYDCAPNDHSIPQIENNLAYLCTLMNDTVSAQRYSMKAYESARRILGETNKLTLQLKEKLSTR